MRASLGGAHDPTPPPPAPPVPAALAFPTPALAVADDVADLLFREARTVAEFAPGDVSDEQLAAVYDLAKWGPTAMNTLPLRLLVVPTPEARERLAALMNEG